MPDQSAEPFDAIPTSVFAETLRALADLIQEADFTLECVGEIELVRIANARGALVDLSINEKGDLTCGYRPFAGRHVDPGQLASLVRGLLDPEAPEGEPVVLRRDDLTLKGVVGRALADQGLSVSVHMLDIDQYFFDIYAEIHLINPAKPERGSVNLSDDGGMWWSCRPLGIGDGTEGLALPEVAAAITKGLIRAGHRPRNG